MDYVTGSNNIGPFNKIVLLGAISLIFVGAVVGLYMLFGPNKDSSRVGNLEDNGRVVEMLSAKSSIVFPKTVSKLAIDPASIPVYVSEFIFAEATALVYESAVFESGGGGYVVTYYYPKKLMDTHKSYIALKFQNWIKAFGARTNNVGVIDFQNERRSARIILESASARDTKVTIFVVGI